MWEVQVSLIIIYQMGIHKKVSLVLPTSPPPPPQKKNSKQTKAYFFVINLSETLRVIADQRLHRLQKAVFVKIDINNNFQRQRLKKQQRTSLVETRTRCSV